VAGALAQAGQHEQAAIMARSVTNPDRRPHALANALGKFLVSAPGHDSPKRARAYLLTDDVVTETAAHYASHRPELDTESRRAILASANPRPVQEDNPADDDSDSPEAAGTSATAEDALRLALCLAPEEGTAIGELMRITGMKRTKLYRHLREHAEAARAVQVSRGHWRARTTEEPSP
jgi:DNA segregation ATPase FtsK/SpoIIIE, S-DNA-T family